MTSGTLPSSDGQSGRAWLVLTKATYRRLGGAAKYDDNPASHYSWDSTVPNHAKVAVGDIVLMWNQTESLGISVIDHITVGTADKRRARCRKCNSVNFEERATMRPIYRCQKCKHTFDDPVYEELYGLTTYRSSHEQGWIDLLGEFTAAELRSLCVKPKSQNSFRPLRWPDTRRAINARLGNEVLRPMDSTTAQLQHGHATKPTRVRIGQRQFRAMLLGQFGPKCAFTGELPEAALDACHLYSYAKVGKHHEHGGVLLRRDLHTLFDRGIIAVDGNDVIDVAADHRRYPAYGSLHGQPLTVKVNNQQRDWFALHWTEHRG
ncbi:HNH endonuclease signature motif containing protein [Nocardia sp. NPDC019304]|uniref:HNH endonuclease signature motif containing protein n=1 Tax=unclassified Nocardia TaxID=2637762 RepID=UPI0033CCB035